MLYREGKISKYELYKYNEENLEYDLDSTFEELELQDKSHFYFSPFSGIFSERFKSVLETKGGIIADEMGLGKTL